MERLSIRSFQAQGHEYHLYCYDSEPDGTPPDVVLEDAAAIIPCDRIFKFRDYYAGFSDLFRWKLLFDRGGWWCDLDVMALKPFEFASEYVFASQAQGRVEIPTSGVARVPAGAPAALWMHEFCAGKQQASYTGHGPDLVASAIGRFALRRHLQPVFRFCPIDWHRWRDVVAPAAPRLHPEAAAVQLWGAMWALGKADRDGTYPPESLYEQLKRRYL
jgi:mannosyltransferase OCH1-like enzyme